MNSNTASKQRSQTLSWFQSDGSGRSQLSSVFSDCEESWLHPAVEQQTPNGLLVFEGWLWNVEIFPFTCSRPSWLVTIEGCVRCETGFKPAAAEWQQVLTGKIAAGKESLVFYFVVSVVSWCLNLCVCSAVTGSKWLHLLKCHQQTSASCCSDLWFHFRPNPWLRSLYGRCFSLI